MLVAYRRIALPVAETSPRRLRGTCRDLTPIFIGPASAARAVELPIPPARLPTSPAARFISTVNAAVHGPASWPISSSVPMPPLPT